MAKIKRKAKHTKRDNPIARKASQAAKDDRKDENTRTTKILPLLEKLNGGKPADKCTAIGMITAMVEDPKLRQMLLKESLIQTVIDKLLPDASEEVVMESYGLLRNIVLEEGYDVAVFMFRKNVIKIASDSLEKIVATCQNIANGSQQIPKGDQFTLLCEFAENILSLLTNMGVTSDDIFDAIAVSPAGVQAVAALLELRKTKAELNPKFPPAVLSAAFEYLYTFSESNPDFYKTIPFDYKTYLEDTTLPIAAQVFVWGLHYNICVESQGLGSKARDASLSKILSRLIIIFNSNSAFADLQAKQDAGSKDGTVVATDKKDMDAIEARSTVNALQVILELITDISEQVTWSGVTEEPEDVDEDMEVDIPQDIDFGHGDKNGAEGAAATSTINLLLNEASAVIEKALTYPPLESRAMAALNNLAWTMASHEPTKDSEQWQGAAQQLWTNVFPMLEKYEGELAIDSLTSAVGVLWAVAAALDSKIDSLTVAQSDFILAQIERVTKATETLTADEIADYHQRAVALVGLLAMATGKTGSQESIALVEKVGEYLLQLLEALPETQNQVALQAVDKIFDIFGDKYPYDEPVFVNKGYLKRLEPLLPKVRHMAKKINKKQNPSLREDADAASQNLMRFIKYKADGN
ncbi:Synchronized import protein 1 [Yarrowia sp. B02]|nr:Synchronized import protein 1 [Yarrowia sp. B02]